ncbi:hypothetical protein M8J77_010558 [Diaphorina citri]|nr:hypothetical protein M8J77_010558 [Diaphorina citri]
MELSFLRWLMVSARVDGSWSQLCPRTKSEAFLKSKHFLGANGLYPKSHRVPIILDESSPDNFGIQFFALGHHAVSRIHPVLAKRPLGGPYCSLTTQAI